MFSEELYIMDRNTERLMVTELQEEVAMERRRADMAEQKAAEAEKMLTETEKMAAEKLNAANKQFEKLLEFAKAHGYKEEP